jgi:HEXXH motif-containing protein
MEPDALAAAVPPALLRHQLSERDFDDLAAGAVDAAVLGQLRRAEHSHRRALLRAVLDELRRTPGAVGPLLPPDAAWDLLVAAEGHAATGTAALLDCPQVGAWAAHLLRRLHGLVHDDTPLWVDAGHLHALTAAALLRAGLPCDLLVPVRHGAIHLPTLGHATLANDEPWYAARVRAAAAPGAVLTIEGPHGQVTVDPARLGASQPRWHPRGSVALTGAGPIATVAFEDADPYRLMGSAARPAPLPGPDARRWEQVLHAAWELLLAGHPGSAAELAALLSTLVPTPRAPQFRPRSASTGDAFGSAAISEPDDATQLAATLVHELAHLKLGALLHLFDLHHPERLRLGYAPWRDDPRPPRGLLHGIYAFSAVTGFWRRQRALTSAGAAMLAHFEFAFWRGQTVETARRLRAGDGLTPLGQRFLDGVLVTMEPWCAEAVPVEVADLAQLLALDHHAQWRAHQLRPPAPLVAALTAAWLAGRDPAPEETAGEDELVPDPAVRHLDGRACLARLWLSDRDGFRRVADDPAQLVAGTTAADCALVSGDRVRARQLYAAMLEAGSDHVATWVGLGLATPGLDALTARPQLVRAVSRAVAAATGRRPEPRRLAAWLTAAGAPTPAAATPTRPAVPGDWPARPEPEPRAAE